MLERPDQHGGRYFSEVTLRQIIDPVSTRSRAAGVGYSNPVENRYSIVRISVGRKAETDTAGTILFSQCEVRYVVVRYDNT